MNDRDVLLIFYLRTARSRAREAAVAEALSVLHDLSPVALPGGPLSERGGLFWVTVRAPALPDAVSRLPRLGYSVAVDRLEPSASKHRGKRDEDEVKWRGDYYRLTRIYEEDSESARELAPDRRTFWLEDENGTVRSMRGYRGTGQDGQKRALPVCDARLLVNLMQLRAEDRFLDPFAGAGGVILEAVSQGCCAFSVDHDPAMRHGLSRLGGWHAVADARRLPFPNAVFQGVAGEPPYHDAATPDVVEALGEMARVTKSGGRLALLCAETQTEPLRAQARRLALVPALDCPINRKGLGVSLLVWEKYG
jgi:SAM-dependent methyltransferase